MQPKGTVNEEFSIHHTHVLAACCGTAAGQQNSAVSNILACVTHRAPSTPKEPEADLEGATRIGDDIYWITSHGQNKNGKNRPSRHRLFATAVAQKATTDFAQFVTLKGAEYFFSPCVSFLTQSRQLLPEGPKPAMIVSA